ncbi:hypothetical protein [Clostridium saccharobutylicum]|uniref:Uncharacterized protein n=1 Tax=Clostridium saccharobutylicum TaxID=169679 RepID=A0A1S8NDU4_CLOSA|nr:hypothetical protein [Clostridium saccharobutylicum]OOM14573.1 hypothetical protein CLOSAC_14530 [Clostridium saccharobutylicum]
MKILRQTIKSILIILIIFALMINTQGKAFSNYNSKAPINVGVILFSLENSTIKHLKQELENLQKEHQINSMVADPREDSVRDFILKVRPYNIHGKCISYWTDTGAMDEVKEYLKYNTMNVREDVINSRNMLKATLSQDTERVAEWISKVKIRLHNEIH